MSKLFPGRTRVCPQCGEEKGARAFWAKHPDCRVCVQKRIAPAKSGRSSA